MDPPANCSADVANRWINFVVASPAERWPTNACNATPLGQTPIAVEIQKETSK